MAESGMSLKRMNNVERDFHQTVVNIGSHPENEIVLSGPEVLPFHATVVLDDGQFRLIPLEPEAVTRVGGELVQDAPLAIDSSQSVEIGSYVLVFKPNGSQNSIHVSLFSTAESEAPRQVLSGSEEDVILLNALSNNAEVDVEQSAIFELEVINAGPIVANFWVTVKGVPDSWVEIIPDTFNLNEGERNQVQIQVTPPRDATSTAGLHTLDAVVNSPNYGGHLSTASLELTINPFYEFTVGNLNPKDQRIPWRKRTGMTHLPITNQGNGPAEFSLLALDDENGCSFDFLINEELQLNRQATTKLQAGEMTELPIQITPLKNPMFAFRGKRYHYTTTVQIPQKAAAPQIISGSTTSVPLFGWWSIVLGIASLMLALFFILQPDIHSFAAAAGKDVIELGDTTKLVWNVSPFATRLSISNVDTPINRGQVSVTVAPTQSTTYELVSGNWLSGLFGLDQKRTVIVLVVPPTPKVNVFEVDKTTVAKGQPVHVRWSVVEADEAYLTIDDVVYPLSKDKFSGEEDVVLEKDALITLEAKNASGSELQSSFVNVVPPHITINSFTVWIRPNSSALGPSTLAKSGGGKLFSLINAPDPNFPVKFVELIPDSSSDTGYRVQFNPNARSELQKGEQIMLEWDVDGADSLQIAPFTDPLPNRGGQPFFPQESMNFVMTAQSGDLKDIFMLPVKVFDGQPPTAPTIEFLNATPTSMQGAGDVQFAWSVSGEWTRVQLSTEDGIVADYLNPQGFKTIKVSKSATYLLTAWNGSLSSAMPVQVTVDPALKPVGIKIKSVYTQGNSQTLMVGGTADVTVDFFSDPNDPSSAEPNPVPTGKVLVSDGVSSCEINLPAVTCTLTFTSPGSPKEIKATYYGDSVYLTSTSDPYTGITVNSAKVKLSINYYYLVKPGMTQGNPIGDITNTPLELDDGLYMVVTVTPVNTVLQNDQKGQIAVRFCEQLSGPTVGTCDALGVATVNVPTGSTNGTADVVIQNFPSAGTHALQIEYSHQDYAIDTETVNQFDVSINHLDIYLSLPVCSDPDALTGCNVGAADIHNGEVMFDLKNAADNSMLSVLLPSPTASDFSIYHSNSGTPVDWSCLIVEKSSSYKLDCKNIDFDTFGTKTVNWQYTATGVYNLIPATSNFSLNVSKSTSLALTTSALAGATVGQPILFTDDTSLSTQLVKLIDASLSPPAQTTLATGKIVVSDSNNTAGLFGITNNSPGCSLAAGGSQLEINSRTARCEAFFNHVGTYTLDFSYEGDVNYAASTTSTQVTVAKQTSIATRWQYKNSSNVYTDWDITSWSPDSPLLPIRIILYDSTANPLPNYAGEALLGRKVHINITINSNPNNGVCTLATNSYVSGSNNEYDVTIQAVGSDFVAQFDVKCTQAKMDVDFNLSISSADQADLGFAPSPTAITTRNVFFANRGSLAMNVSLVRIADSDESISTNPADNIKKLFVGEGYKVVVEVGTIWADYFFGRPPLPAYPYSVGPANLAKAQNYYLNTPLTITLPDELQNRVDTNNSTCSYNSSTNTVSVPFTGFSYKQEWGDDGSHGYSDIRISNSSNPCKLYFTKGTDVGTTVKGAVFTYDAPSPYYSWGFDKTRTFSMDGLGKQNVTMTLGAPVVGNNTLDMFVGDTQQFNIDLAPEVPNTTLAPLTASGLLELGKPASCTNMTSSVTYTAPASSANAILSFPQACTGTLVVSYNGNDYYYITSRNVTTTVTAPTTTTTAVTSSANPSKYGQAVTFTAIVTPSNATGTVQFNIDNVNVGNAVTLTNGQATYTTTAFQLSVTGSPHTIKATYTPSTSGFVYSDGTLSQTVNQSNTTTTLSSSLNPALLGDTVTFTATVAAASPGTGTPTGTVQFKDNGNNLGSPVTLSGGSASYTTSALTSGTHPITAVYAGNTNYATSTSSPVSQAVKLRTQTALSANKSTTVYGESVAFTATVVVVSPGTGTPTGTIQFKDGGTNLGSPVTLSNGSASLAVDTLIQGSHSLTAVYTPSGNFATSTSTVLSHTVQPAATTTALTVTPTTGTATTTLTLTANITVDAPGTGTPTGTVQFYKGPVNNNNLIGTVTLQPNGTAILTTTLAAGNYNVRATFTSNSANFTNSPISNIVTVTIN
jgi:hypothetical protein